jgi:hypothetical protein
MLALVRRWMRQRAAPFSFATLRVLEVIIMRCDWSNGQCDLLLRGIIELAGISPAQTKRALVALIDAGIVQRRRTRPGRDSGAPRCKLLPFACDRRRKREGAACSCAWHHGRAYRELVPRGPKELQAIAEGRGLIARRRRGLTREPPSPKAYEPSGSSSQVKITETSCSSPVSFTACLGPEGIAPAIPQVQAVNAGADAPRRKSHESGYGPIRSRTEPAQPPAFDGFATGGPAREISGDPEREAGEGVRARPVPRVARADVNRVLESHSRTLRPRTAPAAPLPSEMRAAFAALGRGRSVAECAEAFEGARLSEHNRASGRDSVAWILRDDARIDALIGLARRRRAGPRDRVPNVSCTGGPLQPLADDAIASRELARLAALAADELEGAVGELFDVPIVRVVALKTEVSR